MATESSADSGTTKKTAARRTTKKAPAKKAAAKKATPRKTASAAAPDSPETATVDAVAGSAAGTLAPPVPKEISAEALAALDITDTSAEPPASLEGRDPAEMRRILEALVRARAFEDRMHAMYRSGDLLGSYYSGNWHEAIGVGVMSVMRDSDYFCPIHRDVGAHLMRGMPPEQIMGSFMGKAIAPTGGRDGTLHYGRLDLNTYNPPSHIPANFPVATGMAFAAKYRGEDRVTVAICGDGSTSRADFHEAVNIAGAMQLPVVFIIQNNQYAYSTPLPMQTHSASFAIKAVAYGMPGIKCDGTDVIAVREAAEQCIDRARTGGGPSIIETVTMRMHGHAEHDPADYVLPELKETWAQRDPVALFEQRMLDAGLVTDDEAAQIRDDARKWAIEARKIAMSAPMPDPSNIEEGVYAD